MNIGEALLRTETEIITEDSGDSVPPPGSNHTSLRENVRAAVKTYLDQLDGQLATDVYQMVLAEMEAPLLEEILIYTRHNQSKASRMLGLNRGTLRKKLKQHGLLSEYSY